MNFISHLSNNKRRALGIISASAVLVFGAGSQAATSPQYTELSKELEIMTSVLTTSLRQASENQKIQVRGLETQYLAGQGVVYNVQTKGTRIFLHRRSSGFAPPIPPIPPQIFEGSGVFEENERIEVQEAIEEALVEVQHMFEDSSHRLRDTQSEVRSLSWTLRDLSREKDNLEFELRNADESRKKEIKEKLDALDKRNKKFALKQEKLKDAADKLAKEHKQKIEEQRAAVLESNNAFLSAFEQNVADSLCRFGSGLRALPQDEHITFVLDDFNAKMSADKTDRVYVFTASNIKRCVQEKINTKDLLTQARVYDF